MYPTSLSNENWHLGKLDSERRVTISFIALEFMGYAFLQEKNNALKSLVANESTIKYIKSNKLN